VPGRHRPAQIRATVPLESSDKAISPLLRSDFAQSTAGHLPNGDLTDSIVPSDESAAPIER
jgi:hypothetical protein